MNFLTSLHILADGAAPAGGGAAPGGMNPLFLMIIMFGLMYFMLIRPQRKQRQQHEQRIASLRSGDKVITAGGIHGLITNVKNTSVVVRIAENVRVEVEKGSISSIVSKADEPEEPEAAAGDTPDPAPSVPAKD
ncbi:MAG: preprotein translocase subunit YajC [Verrucomicrobiales bacterium]|nr:preprotein translocase subunit YajC [Verrucomicrobiales bacterium]